MPTQKIRSDVEAMKARLAVLLKKAREMSGKTQAQMAEILETTQPTISASESGKTLVSLIMIDRWMQACESECHFVITKKGETLTTLGLTEGK